MNDQSVGIIQTPNAAVQVNRAGQTLGLDQITDLQWGDVVTNTSATPMEIKIPGRGPGQGETLLVMQPQATARLQESPSNQAGTASRTEVVAMTDGVELYDLDNDISSAFMTTEDGAAAGLVGAGLLAGGSAAGAAAVWAKEATEAAINAAAIRVFLNIIFSFMCEARLPRRFNEVGGRGVDDSSPKK